MSNVVYSWKVNGLYKANAENVGKEIEVLGEQFSLKDVVSKAKEKGSCMHTLFEWDNKVAGEKYREIQAGKIVRCLVITRPEPKENPEKTNIRTFVSTNNRDNTYQSIKVVVNDKTEYNKLLDKAMQELKAFKEKYSCLAELHEIIALIG